MQTRNVMNIEIQFNGATSSQISEATKRAITKYASASAILRPILKGTLHPSTSRSDIDIKDVLSFKDKFLYLEYPSIQFTEAGTEQITEEADIQQLLKQHFSARLKKPEDATKIAAKLLSIYSNKSRTSHEEALNARDEWKPND
jgi:hypothetical protein